MPTITLQSSTYETARTDLQLQPINPDWIREGAPIARALTVTQSPDSLLTAGLWDCSAGVFTWIFAADEIVHILEGEVPRSRRTDGAVARPRDRRVLPARTRDRLGRTPVCQEGVRPAVGEGLSHDPARARGEVADRVVPSQGRMNPTSSPRWQASRIAGTSFEQPHAVKPRPISLPSANLSCRDTSRLGAAFHARAMAAAMHVARYEQRDE